MEAKSWGGRRSDPFRSPPVFTIKGFDFFPPYRAGRGGNRQVNVTPFHAGSFLRNPSLPAGIIVAGATSPWGVLDRTPQCPLQRGARAERDTKQGGRSRHFPPPPTGAEAGRADCLNHK